MIDLPWDLMFWPFDLLPTEWALRGVDVVFLDADEATLLAESERSSGDVSSTGVEVSFEG
jgi:hypothetical protein